MSQAQKQTIVMSDRTYIGANPVYSTYTDKWGVERTIKTEKGVPFIKVKESLS
jgi:hypothetical protein